MLTETKNNKILTNESNLNLFATLSIFVSKVPGLLVNIQKSVTEQNITDLEEYAAKLIIFSDNAQLEGFTERVKNLIIAARENKFHIAEGQLIAMKECFEKLTKTVNEIV